MNPQETQQVVARNEKWVPFTERVKQFWYSIKKIQGTDSYEFLLANKKCVVNADVFRTILDICPRVKGVNFTDVPDDDTTLAFLIKLGYKGPLYKHTNLFVDHMHQQWRTLAVIMNKSLSGKTTSNDKIDHRKKRSRHENMPFPRFTKFVKIGEDYQEYGLLILETMLTEAIKQSESYQMFIKYSTESEPEPVKRKTSSKRRVKKKVTLSADDNIIYDDPDTALELGKSINKTKAEEAEAARQVHATHARIVTESVLEPTKRRKSGKVTFDPPKKLKGVPSLTPEEQEAADIMQTLKESKKTSKRQPCTEGLSEGIGTISGVPDESTVVSATSSEGIGTISGVPDESTVVSATSSEGTKQESKYLKEDKIDDEEKDDKEGDADDEDDIYKYKIRVRKDEDEEMINAEVED
ncbi:hypothetical protein Tco_1072059, partial [Tanacetum coccineum]